MARPKSAAARDKMLQAAQEIIGLAGLEGCTIDEVARRSGVARTTIYRHFGSADELLLAAVDDLVEEIAVPDTGTLRGDLEEVIGALLDASRAPEFRQLYVSILRRALVDAEFAASFRGANEQRHVALRTAIQRAIARGEIHPDINIELALQFVQGPFLVKRLIENEDISPRELSTLLDLIVRALTGSA
jgi:AcrR family transcriptional regulator